MKRSYMYLVIAVVVTILCLGAAMQVYAEEKQAAQQENKVIKFFKDLINWPFGITKKSSEAVGRTTKKATSTVTTTGSSAVETVTGKPEKLKDVIVEPVKGTAETVYTAVEGAIKAPIEGTSEAFKSEEKE